MARPQRPKSINSDAVSSHLYAEDISDTPSLSQSHILPDSSLRQKRSSPSKAKNKAAKDHPIVPEPSQRFASFWDVFSFTNKKADQSQTDRIRKRRSRVYNKNLFTLIGFIISAFLLLTIFLLGFPQKLSQQFITHITHLTSKYGLNLLDVQIIGRKNTSKDYINQSIQVALRSPIIEYDLNRMQLKLMESPWIKAVVVRRKLPHTLCISITERVPIALWQDKNKHYLVDSEGVVLNVGIDPIFRRLPIVAGENAPLHAPRILSLLKEFPSITKRTSGLIRIRERRWNLTLDDCITIKLPDEHVERALAQLSFLLEKNKISKDNVLSIDLRNPNQLFIKLTDQASKVLKLSATKGRTKV